MRLADLMADGPTRVVGIVNVGDDSFADTVRRDVGAAIERGLELSGQGADLIDVGGQSTRPGAERVSVGEELARVVPVVEALAATGIAVSVDTVRSAVAAAALRAGAIIVNDVSGGLADPGMHQVVADRGAGYVLQHWRTAFDHHSSHVDVVVEVCSELMRRASDAVSSGVDPTRLILDPGIGFGKTAAQNWQLIAQEAAIADLGFPVLWGVSRKRFLAEVFDGPTEPWERDVAGVGLTTYLAQRRVWGVRTHTVSDHRCGVAVAEAIRENQAGKR